MILVNALLLVLLMGESIGDHSWISFTLFVHLATLFVNQDPENRQTSQQ
jgi:hypothetical protein